MGNLGGSFGWDIFGGDIGTNLKFAESRFVSLGMLSSVSSPPLGSYAPVSPSLVPVDRLTT